MKMEKKRAILKTAETGKEKKNNTTMAAKRDHMAQEKICIFIPEDIISEILLRLPARSLGKFRCLSKSSLSITSDTAFVRANTRHNLITRRSLIIGECEHYKLPIKSHLAFADDSTSEPTIRLQPLECSIPQNSYVVASCDGLLCLRRFEYFHHHYIINPLTGQYIALPRDSVPLNLELGFYFHCSTSQYRLLRFIGATMHKSQVLVVGESSWRHIPINIPHFFCPRSPLDLNGNLYWLAHTRDVCECKVRPNIIVVFDEEEEVYSVISTPPLKMLQDIVGGNLINFNGELGLWVVGMDYTIDVWIMGKLWIKRYSVNYARIDNCPSRFTAAWSQRWILGRAISIGDEELLLDLSKFQQPHYLVRWNLKSGACVVRHVIDDSSQYRSTFSYTETLTNPACSAFTSRSFKLQLFDRK